MKLIFKTLVMHCVKTAEKTVNRPSQKFNYQEKLPEAVKKLKKYQ